MNDPGSTPLEIMVLGIGHPGKASTWSNVPAFFSEELERQGCLVHRVDIGPWRPLQLAYDAVLELLPKGERNMGRNYFRSRLNRFLTDRRIRRSLRRHPGAFPVFMTYSFGSTDPKRPYALFCDRTLEHHFRYFGITPTGNGSRNIAIEAGLLDRARLVITLFPGMAEELRKRHGDKVKYYGNVVNLTGPERTELDGSDGRWEDQRLLFIGGSHYRDGLERLLLALPLVSNGTGRPVQLDVVGMTAADVQVHVPPAVQFHGYLDKDKPEEAQRYRSLLSEACLFVNPNPKWAAFSASVEAMSYGVPPVVPPYPEFVRTFGSGNEAWYALNDLTPEAIAEKLRTALGDRQDWRSRSRAAQQAVRDFTWPAFVQQVLEDVRECLAGERLSG